MSLPRKAENVRRGGTNAMGLLARAMVYRRSMETAGLLSRAVHLKNKAAGVEAAGESRGLLHKGEAGVSSQITGAEEAYEEGQGQGFLARALKFREEFTRGVTSGAPGLYEAGTGITGAIKLSQPSLSDNGLLAKALRYRSPAPGAKGLLEKAEEYAFSSAEFLKEEPVTEEMIRETGKKTEEILFEPVETETVFLEEVQLQPEETIEEIRTKPRKVSRLKEKPRLKEEPGPEEAPQLKEEPRPEEAPQLKEEPRPETVSSMLLKYIDDHDVLELTQLFSRAIAEGYEPLMQQVLEAAVHAGGGKKGVIFTAQKSSFVPECIYGIEWGKKGRKPSPARQLGIRFKKKSAFVEYLVRQGTSVVRGADIKDDRVMPDLMLLSEFEPCTLLPLVTGGRLSGIIVIGNHSKRPKQDKEGLLLLARIFSIHLYTFVLERSLQKTIEEYSGKNRELTSLLSLYDFAGFKGIDLDEVLKNIAEMFDIESAVLAGGWDSRGPVRVYAGFGLSEKGLRHYRVSKTDRDLKAVIKSGTPGVLPNAGKLLEKLPEEDRKRANTCAAVPVVFNGETLALLFVHRMKGVTARISGKSGLVLKNVANTLVPFLLYVRITELEPFEVLEALLKREAQRAKKKKGILNIVAFKIKNYRAIIKSSGFRQYRNLLHQFNSLIKKSVGKGDIVQTVALNKVILLLIRKEQEQVGEVMKKVKSATNVLLDKKKAGIALSYSPLRTSYPNESKSIPEILQLIE